MPYVSTITKNEQDNEQQALDNFKENLRRLTDPRRSQGRRYPMQLVVVVALMAAVCGCGDADAMQKWGKVNRNWLVQFLPMPHGTPSQDVFLSVFAGLDPKALEELLFSWSVLMSARFAKQGISTVNNNDTVDENASDDMNTSPTASGRSFDMAKRRVALHTISACLTQAGLVHTTPSTEDPSSEMAVTPEQRRLLDLRGTTTAAHDAMDSISVDNDDSDCSPVDDR